ncbi:shikimate dehydrogenase [Pseudomaricurvus alcaniphilus]|uniref:shikimate dehydrogenase n=1 Tax=Pseudomaricurvus alcaniphilus TaxID=1166482 RepID=UPI00140B873C|nr:shikimate dehydrogenase [Pseudomaricurvus alcaniphilus]NHN38809.1 shikimate dehydrogenase [Pseudomaricurvus alcaniphilus]
MMDRYAVFGCPIEHSKSPLIHRLFAEQTGEQLVYEKELVAEGEFNTAADSFFDAGGRGLNITAPHKIAALKYAARLTERARVAGAVNTLALDHGGVLGDNTDGVGLVTDIINIQGWDIRAQRLLILGAGGAVRGVLQPLLAQAPAQLVIANRTPAKALQLAREFRLSGEAQACGFEDLQGQQFDLVINATAASLAGELPRLPDNLLAADAACYDMTYAAEPTVFLQWAADHGASHCADGLGMLVGQAAESFYLWRGKRPRVEPVLEVLRQALSAN